MNEKGELIDEFTTKVIEGITKKNKTRENNSVEAHGSRGQMVCDPPIIKGLRRLFKKKKKSRD